MRRISSTIASAAANLAHAMASTSYDDATGRPKFIEALDGLLSVFRDLPMPPSLIDQVEQVKIRALDGTYPVLTLLAQAGSLQRAFYIELTRHVFFMVPETHKGLYLDPEKWFGVHTLLKFHGLTRDVRDACQCFALAQWTASVFHSMRILERGLVSLAESVGLDQSAMGLENWKNILDQIDKKIRQMEALPRGPEKSADLQFFSEAATQFRYFKDAWRNHVSHARADYDEQDARTILDHVRDFMSHLALRGISIPTDA